MNYKGKFIAPRSEIEIDMDCKDNNVDNFEKELVSIKGIGKKNVREILAFAKNKKELLNMSNDDLYARLRDDIAEKIINKYKDGEQ